METATNERLNALLDYLTDTMKSGVDFASEQAPLVAKEIIMYGAITSWAGVAAGIFFLLVGLLFLAFSVKRMSDDADTGFAALMAAGVLLFFSAIFFGSNTGDAIKATFAPRVYVLEYVAKLVK